MFDKFVVCVCNESFSFIRMSISINGCVGFVDLANYIRFNPLNTFVANGLATALAFACLSRRSLLRTVCVQATRVYFCTGTGAKEEEEEGEQFSVRANVA